LLVLPAAGVVGLFAAYTIPLFPVMLTGFVLLPRTWPGENPNGKPQALRDIAGLSVGNWLSAFGYAIPYLCGPALVLYFFDPTTAAFFFIALQLGEILNYGSDALTKSLFAHGSRAAGWPESRSDCSWMRRRTWVRRRGSGAAWASSSSADT